LGIKGMSRNVLLKPERQDAKAKVKKTHSAELRDMKFTV
jgi:hypothetical protein